MLPFLAVAGEREKKNPDLVASEWICKTGLIIFSANVLPLLEESRKKIILCFYACGFEKNHV